MTTQNQETTHECRLDHRRRPLHPLGVRKGAGARGHPFKSFGSAAEALATLDAGAPPPQVLVSDIRMPGESRPRCCRRSRRAIRPCRSSS
jgi:CheY-like chemotaxis protein